MLMRIAIVGNGPLKDEQMDRINTFDRVVMMNFCNNKRDADKITDFVVRYQNKRTGFVGDLNQINFCDVIHFLNHDTSHCINTMNKLRQDKSFVTYHKEILEHFDLKHVSRPSTGYIVILYFLHTYSEDDIEVFGFNWNPQHRKYHPQISIEEENIKGLNLKVNQSPCGLHHTFATS